MSLPTGPEQSSPRSLQQWLAQGESLYTNLLKDCEAIEAQIAELETRLTAKQAEANQIATFVGKPPIESNRRLSAQLVTTYAPEPPAPKNPAQIARALAANRMARDVNIVREPAQPRN